MYSGLSFTGSSEGFTGTGDENDDVVSTNELARYKPSPSKSASLMSLGASALPRTQSSAYKGSQDVAPAPADTQSQVEVPEVGLATSPISHLAKNESEKNLAEHVAMLTQQINFLMSQSQTTALPRNIRPLLPVPSFQTAPTAPSMMPPPTSRPGPQQSQQASLPVPAKQKHQASLPQASLPQASLPQASLSSERRLSKGSSKPNAVKGKGKATDKAKPSRFSTVATVNSDYDDDDDVECQVLGKPVTVGRPAENPEAKASKPDPVRGKKPTLQPVVRIERLEEDSGKRHSGKSRRRSSSESDESQKSAQSESDAKSSVSEKYKGEEEESSDDFEDRDKRKRKKKSNKAAADKKGKKNAGHSIERAHWQTQYTVSYIPLVTQWN